MRYRKGYKYQLTEDEQVYLPRYKDDVDIETDYIKLYKDGELIIKRGYAWDGASGGAIDTKTIMRASCVHDALYQLIRMGKLSRSKRMWSDGIMRHICLLDRMASPRAAWVHWFLRKFGWSAVRKPKEIFIAP